MDDEELEESLVEETAESELRRRDEEERNRALRELEKQGRAHAKDVTRKARKKISRTLFKPVGITVFSTVLSVVIVIFMLIGIVSFIVTMPGLVQENIMNKVFQNLDSLNYFIKGPDYYLEYLAKDTERKAQKEVLKYLDDMGLEPAGFGFAPFYERYGDDVEYSIDMQEIPLEDTDETEEYVGKGIVNASLIHLLRNFRNAVETNRQLEEKIVNEDLIFKYIVSNERTFLVDDKNKDFAWIADLFSGAGSKLTGMIKMNSQGYTLNIDRATKTLNITTTNLSELSKQTVSFNMDDYTGRYGMPLEFLLALHLSTMTSDLTEEMITNKNLQTEVNIETQVNNYNMEYKVTYKGKPIGNLEGSANDVFDLQKYVNGYVKQNDSGEMYVDLRENDIEKIKTKFNIFSLYGWISEMRKFNFSNWTAAQEIYDNTHSAKIALQGEDAFRVVYKICTTDYTTNAGIWSSYFGDVEEIDGKYSTDIHQSVSDVLDKEILPDGRVVYQYDTDFDTGMGYQVRVSPNGDSNTNRFDPDLELNPAKGKDTASDDDDIWYIDTGVMHGIKYYMQPEHTAELKQGNTRLAMMSILSQLDAYLYANNLDPNLFTHYADTIYNDGEQYSFGVRRGEFQIINQIQAKGSENNHTYELLLTKKWIDFCDSHGGIENCSDEEIRNILTEISNNIEGYFDVVLQNGEHLSEEQQNQALKSLLSQVDTNLAESDIDVGTVIRIYNLLKDRSDELEMVEPRIKNVIKHWYKDIIFSDRRIATDAYSAKSGVKTERHVDVGSDDIDVTAVLSQKDGTSYTQGRQPYVVKGDVVTLDGDVVTDSGVENLVFPDPLEEVVLNEDLYRVGDGYRTTKKLFTEGKYYTYDGSQETAKSIWFAKQLEKLEPTPGNPCYATVYVRKGRISVASTYTTAEEASQAFGDAFSMVSSDASSEYRTTENNGWTVYLAKESVSNSTKEKVQIYYVRIDESLKYKSPADYSLEETDKSVERINGLLNAMGVVTQRKPISFDGQTQDGDITTLTAFSILEGMHTQSAEYIYRDLKEFLVELGYYTKAEFEQIETNVLTWFLPDYVPDTEDAKINWRQNKDEDLGRYGAVIYPEVTGENGETVQSGFKPGIDVVAPGNCRIIAISEGTADTPEYIKIQFDGLSEPEIGMLDGFTMTIYGIDVSDVVMMYNGDEDEGIETGIQNAIDNKLIIKEGSVIGHTRNEKIRVVLTNHNGAWVNNVEDYMGPKLNISAGAAFSGTLSEELYYILGVMMEGLSNEPGEYFTAVQLNDNIAGYVTVGPGLLMSPDKVESYKQKGGTVTAGMNTTEGSLWRKDIIMEMYIEYVDTHYLAAVETYLDGYEVSQTQMEALVCACYQLGAGDSGLINRIKQIKAGANADVLYNTWVVPYNNDYSSSNPFPGVYSRRYAEWYLYKYGKYINPYSNSITGNTDREIDFGSDTPFTDFINGK